MKQTVPTACVHLFGASAGELVHQRCRVLEQHRTYCDALSRRRAVDQLYRPRAAPGTSTAVVMELTT